MKSRLPYAALIFCCAALSFAIEPMAAKALLPALGGTPSVWTTCLLFFQLALLVGYLIQLALARVRPVVLSTSVHAVLLLLPLLIAQFDVIGHANRAASASHPMLGALQFLLTTVGAPFVALSTVGPALQRAFARASEKSPYRLYAASNAGSAVGLLAYPFVLEPLLTLSQQASAFRTLYAVSMVAVIALCLASARRQEPTSKEGLAEAGSDHRPWLQWLVYAAVPSALLATVSSTIVTDLPGIPLLWVTPLFVYLLTFVWAFARGREAPAWVGRAVVVLALVLVPATLRRSTQPFALMLTLHLAVLALVSFLAHARLAATAPNQRYLEQFYLAIAVGGVLGTLTFGILPPLVLNDLWEAPVLLALCAGLRTHPPDPSRTALQRARMALPLVWITLIALLLRATHAEPTVFWLVGAYLPAILLATLSAKPGYHLSLALLGLVLGGVFLESSLSITLVRTRSFFGVTQVQQLPHSDLVMLIHGTTIHGAERRAARGHCEQRAYYRVDGPLGRAMSFRREHFANGSVFAIGLGAGSVLCHARAGESWTFVEIDPEVAALALNPRWFTFLTQPPAGVARPRIVIGDGRLALRTVPAGVHSMVLMDAFNSDTVPLHLLTREAVALSMRALRDDGWLIMHASNRALDLPRVISALAHDANLAAVVNADATDFTGRGSVPTWILIARRPDLLPRPEGAWRTLPDPRGLAAFSDTYASIVRVLRW